MTAGTQSRGLEDVVAATTALSAIDGTNGRLSYVGYSIHDIVEYTRFEEVVYLLWHGELPTAAQLADFCAALADARTLTAEDLAFVRALPRTGHGMDALRTLASGLAQIDERTGAPLSEEEAQRVGVRMLGRLPAALLAWNRLRNGLEPVSPDANLSHAANILLMLKGERPTAEQERAMNTYLMLLAEHGLNASTFAGRVAIGAQADVAAALVAAISVLKGLLHGGANQKAMETFLAIETPENAAPYLDAMLARKERLMGVGHRIYKVEDPRVRHLRAQVGALAQHGDARWQQVADAVGHVVAEHPHFVKRQLAPNVEFYSAPLLYMLGFPLDLFTCAFAFSRIGGWVGHIREQIADNRLIRPKAAYNGPAPREIQPIDERDAVAA